MTASEKLSLSHLLGKEYNKIQADLILAREFEVAAVTGMGAGKTYALCVAAARHALKWPGANILISRLTFRELIDSTKRQFYEMCENKGLRDFIERPQRFDYREGTNNLRFKNGSEVTFANLEPGKIDKIKNLEYSFIGIDQAEEIDYSTYQVLLLRCRLNSVPPTDRHVVSIANDEGDNWLRKRFLTFEAPHGRPTAQATRRLLRGSSLDNPHLDEGARAQLLSLPKEVQARYVYATMAAGSTRLIPDLVLVPHFDPPAHWPRFLGVDPARSTGVTCAVWLAVNPDDKEFKGVKPNAPYIYQEYWAEGREAEHHAEEILRLSGRYPIRARIMDRSAWSSSSLSRKMGSVNIAQLYVNAGLGVAPSDGDEWARVGLFQTAQKRGMVVSATCSSVIRQAPEYRVRGQAIFDHTGSAKNLKIVGKQHFHAVDAAGYALASVPSRVNKVDTDELMDAFEISEDLDRHSKLHWETARKELPKTKGGQPVITWDAGDFWPGNEQPMGMTPGEFEDENYY